MKRIALLIAFVAFTCTLRAQSCDSIWMAYFNGDTELIASYPQHKLDVYCEYARAAFYEADQIPTGAHVFDITEVVNKTTGKHLPANYVVDLQQLIFYSYNFESFQLRYPDGDAVICFPTPASTHPYLVLRSSSQIDQILYEIFE